MTINQAEETVNQSKRFLLEKKHLLLEVSVETEEDVDEVLRWMYSNKSPMRSKLNRVSWDMAVVPQNASKLLVDIAELYRNGELE